MYGTILNAQNIGSLRYGVRAHTNNSAREDFPIDVVEKAAAIRRAEQERNARALRGGRRRVRAA